MAVPPRLLTTTTWSGGHHGYTKTYQPEQWLYPAFLDHLEPADKRLELRDTRAPGLRLRLEITGRKTFVWHYKDGPRTWVLTLGQYSGNG